MSSDDREDEVYSALGSAGQAGLNMQQEHVLRLEAQDPAQFQQQLQLEQPSPVSVPPQSLGREEHHSRGCPPA